MIQIGAVKVNENYEVVDSFSQLIQPQHYIRLHPRISRITHITQDDLADAPDFNEAMAAFAQWCGEDYVLLTWGCDDISVLYQNMTFFKCETELPKFYDAQQLFGEVTGNAKERKGLKAAMEQLEIDWKYADAIQAADNENQVKYVVRDIFTKHGLDVTFMAKPFDGVAGSGEHTHIGLAAKLKDGSMISLFAPGDMKKHFMSPVGFGALMGILKNYEVINPFISSSNDSLNRLKPGFEAPVCIVTSLGKGIDRPSRNRTVLVGLIRDAHNPLSTRFELRAPNPKSNTYLVLASAYMAVVDGIRAVLENEKDPEELEASLSKKHGVPDFYLETEREYRSEEDVFIHYTEEEREHLFGKAPATVWENLAAFDKYPEKTRIFSEGGVMNELLLASYREQILSQWKLELHDRLIPNTMVFIRSCKKRHSDDDFSDYDMMNWSEIDRLRHELGKDTISEKCLLTRAKEALDKKEYDKASAIQLAIKDRVERLTELYNTYKKNLL